ncbi:hypothetical protein CBR_g12452 [Chara braunii]|uniref:Gustatory receptor n=1 Tax=Chara braunii TaxID=69332 RepID=A0A388JSC3_CHABU|nr:hypothetical protein CBR_g12452 [Chara braunii]|eukprot:GBG60714.1 hypothetical protein CBR_g12452 [Chara braunii]
MSHLLEGTSDLTGHSKAMTMANPASEGSLQPLLHEKLEEAYGGECDSEEVRLHVAEDVDSGPYFRVDDDKSDVDTDIHLLGDIDSPTHQRFNHALSMPAFLGRPKLGRQQNTEGSGELERQHGSSVHHIRTGLRILHLDHSRSSWGCLSWTVGLLMIVVIPFLRFAFVHPLDDEDPATSPLPFRSVVFILEFFPSAISFVCFHHMLRTHGLRGVLFLDAVHDEPYEIRQAYERSLRSVMRLLFKLTSPAFALHVIQKALIYVYIPLAPFPITTGHWRVDLGVVFVITSLAWLFQTTTFLFVCVIFWKICSLQVLKMRHYSFQLQKYDDSSKLFFAYSRIIRGLGIISHRFRGFLSLSGVIIVLGTLASMYNVVQARKGNLSFINTGELAVCNCLYLMGGGLCLRSASRIAHQHRRIVKQACTMHARSSYGCGPVSPCTTPPGSVPVKSASPPIAALFTAAQDPTLARIEAACERQEEWCHRAALIGFLSQTTAGISVYGFVLDRAFVHTSFGALCTTTWFILGRSLGA